MKKTIFAMAAMLAMGLAFATPPGVTTGGGSVNGSATSNVGGATYSTSTVSGLNQFSAHGSFATSQNTTTVAGFAAPDNNGASAGTIAVTHGSTMTGAGGIGFGGASSYAAQGGFGNVTAIANVANCDNLVGSVTATSGAGVFTFSGANVVNSGAALSGSHGGAFNRTLVSVSGANTPNSATTYAVGSTLGADGIVTWGGVIGSNESVTAGGASEQGGSYFGTITNTLAVNVSPVQCDRDCGSNDNGGGSNNGFGNGDQPAPGNSRDHNNAENSGRGHRD